VAEPKRTTRKLTEPELARVVLRLQGHAQREVREAVGLAIGVVVNETLQKKHPINQLPVRVISCVGMGARLVVNDMASMAVAVEYALDALAQLPVKRPPKAVVRLAIKTLTRRGAGRPKGRKTGTREVAIVALLKACGLPTTTEAAVSKLLRRHARIDLTVIKPTSTG
jgi:hypothetical protein